MRKIFLLATTLLGLGLTPALAQFGPRSSGPQFSGALGKLFGANQSFSSDLEFHVSGSHGDNTTMPGKMSFDAGKSRFEMNMSEMQGAKMPSPQQMKAMGMDSMISISRPDLKFTYLVYPGLNSYVAMASPETPASVNPDDYKVETTPVGKETVDGHDCVKNEVTVTDKDSHKHLSTVWNASDLKDFPVKIVMNEEGNSITMLYRNISFAKPAASLFDAPSGLTKYDNLQTMMQTEMLKKMGGGGLGRPPSQN